MLAIIIIIILISIHVFMNAFTIFIKSSIHALYTSRKVYYGICIMHYLCIA